jgi:hypothetical protein
MMKDWKRYGMSIDFSHEGGDSDIMWRAKLMVVTDEVLQQLHESCAMEMISMSESSISSGVNGMS